MSTPYSKIYDLFLNKISDDMFISLTTENKNAILNGYLKSACSDFKKCKYDLSDRNDTTQLFNVDLDDIEVEILSIGMVYNWINPKVLNVENLKNALNTKDFSQFSPANLLKEITSLRDKLKSEFKTAITNYTYDNADISELKS